MLMPHTSMCGAFHIQQRPICPLIPRAYNQIMAAPDLLRSQRNSVLKAITEAGFDKSDFEWEAARDNPYSSPIPQIVHKPTGYYFQFDYVEGDLMRQSTRVARYAPGRESPREYSRCRSWTEMLITLMNWLKYIRRETEEDELWEEDDYEKFDSWLQSNSKFTKDELNSINAGLDRVEQLIISHSDKTEQTMTDINESIKYLKSAAKTSGRRDWLMMFIGVAVSKLAELGIRILPWQLIVTELLKGFKGFLPGSS